jgi:hypothetical protein
MGSQVVEAVSVAILAGRAAQWLRQRFSLSNMQSWVWGGLARWWWSRM